MFFFGKFGLYCTIMQKIHFRFFLMQWMNGSKNLRHVYRHERAVIKKALNCVLLTILLVVLHRPTQGGLFKAGRDLLDPQILKFLEKKTKTMRKVQL